MYKYSYCGLAKTLSAMVLASAAVLPSVAFSTPATQVIGVSFVDVPFEAWYATYVTAAIDVGIVTGYLDSTGARTFRPSNDVTLAEALKMSLLAAGYEWQKYPPFEGIDDSQGHWVHPYYRITVRENFPIFVGAFEHVDERASRADLAVIIAKAFNPENDILSVEPTAIAANPFQDVSSDNWTSAAILSLWKNGVLSGDRHSDGSLVGLFRPQDIVNRAEAIKAVMTARNQFGQVGRLRP